MIEKILILSSEHQPYRRAGQLAALTVANAPIEDMLEFLYAFHFNDYSTAALCEKLDAIGFSLNFREQLERGLAPPMLSQYLMELIALQKIIAEKKNTLFLYDDYYFNCQYGQLESELLKLSSVGGDADIVAVSCNGLPDPSKKHRVLTAVKRVEGIDFFSSGCPLNVGGAYFYTPRGAQRVLDQIASDGEFAGMDYIIPYQMHGVPGIYCVLENYRYFRGVQELNGDSVCYLLGHPVHKKHFQWIEKYKLMPFGGRDD